MLFFFTNFFFLFRIQWDKCVLFSVAKVLVGICAEFDSSKHSFNKFKALPFVSFFSHTFVLEWSLENIHIFYHFRSFDRLLFFSFSRLIAQCLTLFAFIYQMYVVNWNVNWILFRYCRFLNWCFCQSSRPFLHFTILSYPQYILSKYTRCCIHFNWIDFMRLHPFVLI